MADTTSLHLRLPKRLYKKLQQQARRNNVSLNTEIVNQLEGHEAATIERIKPVIKEAVAERMIATKMTFGITIGTLKELGHTISPEHYEKVLAAVWGYADKEIAASSAPTKEPEQK